MLNEMFGNR
jgi:hypothetical protein